MKLLHIDSSVLGPHSVSRQVSAAIVDRLRQTTPSLQLVYRDLTQTPLAHLSGSHLAAAQGAPAPKSGKSSFAAIQNQEDAPPCSTCGSIMVRSGACYKCTNCGTTSGCA